MTLRLLARATWWIVVAFTEVGRSEEEQSHENQELSFSYMNCELRLSHPNRAAELGLSLKIRSSRVQWEVQNTTNMGITVVWMLFKPETWREHLWKEVREINRLVTKDRAFNCSDKGGKLRKLYKEGTARKLAIKLGVNQEREASWNLEQKVFQKERHVNHFQHCGEDGSKDTKNWPFTWEDTDVVTLIRANSKRLYQTPTEWLHENTGIESFYFGTVECKMFLFEINSRCHK